MSQATPDQPFIWVNGSVVGRRELDKTDDRMQVVTGIYTKISKGLLKQVEDERANLENFVNGTLLPVSGGL